MTSECPPPATRWDWVVLQVLCCMGPAHPAVGNPLLLGYSTLLLQGLQDCPGVSSQQGRPRSPGEGNESVSVPMRSIVCASECVLI